MPADQDYRRIEHAIAVLVARRAERPSLADLASALGLSPFHAHRLFARWAGVTPKDFLQALTLAEAKPLLREGSAVLDAALSVGLSGPGRLHDLFTTIEAMTPGEYAAAGAGLEIRWGLHPTPFGDAVFAATARGLCGLAFVGDGVDAAIEEVRVRWPHASWRRDPAATRDAAKAAGERMLGRAGAMPRLVARGTPFQLQVWHALLRIPEGATATYAQVAAVIGAPSAARAVGAAIGANPIGWLIPCHRVLRASGAIAGYRWGEARKRAMLAAEGARAVTSVRDSGTAAATGPCAG